MKIERSPEIEAITRRLWKSFQDASEPAIANIFSLDPSVRMILSADDQWFSGGPAVASLAAERAALMGIQRTEFHHVEAYEAGDFGWAAASVTATLSTGETFSFRWTGAFLVDDGVWRLVQGHTSVGVPQAEVFGVELDEGLSTLIGSLGQASAAEIAGVAGTSGVVTLMFTDIEDSTLLSELRGDSQWSQDIQAHFEAVGRIVDGNTGKVVKTLGDGSMAAFASAAGAADAALRIQEFDDDLRVRIGIHTGEAVAVGDDFLGIAVAKAARITSAAGGGETLISSTTRELLERFDYDIGPEQVVELKGINGTHRLFPLGASKR